jgi:hypothetical protein
MWYDKEQENIIKIEEEPEHVLDTPGQINETPGNIFDYENSYALVNYISADFAFDAGLPKLFQARYSTRDDLRQRFPHYNWDGHGHCLCTNNLHVLNLVTKNRYFEKSTLVAIEEALLQMKEFCEIVDIYKIAMPRIGENWQDVKDIIMNIFMGTNFDIRIVYLNEYYDGHILEPDLELQNFGKDREHIDGNVEKKYY